MRYLLMLFLSLSFVINSEESDFKEGDKFEAKKFDTISLYFYKADATRLNLARDLSYSLKDFVDYAAIDYRDIYKIRKGETFVLYLHFVISFTFLAALSVTSNEFFWRASRYL